MKINDNDILRLEQFIDLTIAFLDKKSQNTFYKKRKITAYTTQIELTTGEMVSAESEMVFVLDNEFQSFVISTALKLIALMQENYSNRLFGFSERPAYEYITQWLFLFCDPNVTDDHKKRAKTLLLVGHYRYVTKRTVDYDKYMEQRAAFLKPKDIEALNSMDVDKYFDYVWKVVKGIVQSYGNKPTSYLDSINFQSIISFQHMRTHANPLSINELVGIAKQSDRHKLLTAYYLRQIVEYFKSSDRKDYERLRYYFEKFTKNNKIKID